MTEQQLRTLVVEEALSWRQTPFVHGQCVKGVAADCATFISYCFSKLDIFCATIPNLQSDWFIHTKKQFYLEELGHYAVEYTLKEHTPEPADIILVKDVAIGAKVFSHGAIVISWGPNPEVIHCFPPAVMTSKLNHFHAFAGKNLKFFDPFRKGVYA